MGKREERKGRQRSSSDESDEFAFGVRVRFSRACEPLSVGFIRADLMLFGLGRGRVRLARDIYQYTESYVTPLMLYWVSGCEETWLQCKRRGHFSVIPFGFSVANILKGQFTQVTGKKTYFLNYL